MGHPLLELSMYPSPPLRLIKGFLGLFSPAEPLGSAGWGERSCSSPELTQPFVLPLKDGRIAELEEKIKTLQEEEGKNRSAFGSSRALGRAAEQGRAGVCVCYSAAKHPELFLRVSELPRV